jgi:hypothetical protein
VNNQELFDFVARTLIKQGGPSLIDGRCAYRSPEGRRCAAGILVPEGIDLVEGMTIDEAMTLDEFADEPHLALIRDNLEMVRRLQFVHDMATEPLSPDEDPISDDDWMASWLPAMSRLAAELGLSDAVLSEGASS